MRQARRSSATVSGAIASARVCATQSAAESNGLGASASVPFAALSGLSAAAAGGEGEKGPRTSDFGGYVTVRRVIRPIGGT
jgi:hypothetical protein